MRHVTTSLVLGLALALTACGTANDQPASGTLDATAAPAPVTTAKSVTIKDDKQKPHALSYDMAALDHVTLDGKRLDLVPQYDIAFTDGYFLLKGKRGADDLAQLELMDLDVGSLTHPDCEIGEYPCGRARANYSTDSVESFAPAASRPDCDPVAFPCDGSSNGAPASSAKINAILGIGAVPPCDPNDPWTCRPPTKADSVPARSPDKDRCQFTGDC